MVKKSGQAAGRKPAGGGPLEKPLEAGEVPAAGRWTFLTNHAHVMILLSQHPQMVLREVAVHVGITERAVQRIIADLEAAGYIEVEKVGRQNRYRILESRALRHPIEAHHTIGELLEMVVRTGA
jgi:DNA-binding transcriptional ArsR family regulator